MVSSYAMLKGGHYVRLRNGEVFKVVDTVESFMENGELVRELGGKFVNEVTTEEIDMTNYNENLYHFDCKDLDVVEIADGKLYKKI